MVFLVILFSVLLVCSFFGIVEGLRDREAKTLITATIMLVSSVVVLFLLGDLALKGNTDITTYEFSSTQYDWHVVQNVEPSLVIVDGEATIQYDTTWVLMVTGEEKSLSIASEPGKKVTSKVIDKREKY